MFGFTCVTLPWKLNTFPYEVSFWSYFTALIQPIKIEQFCWVYYEECKPPVCLYLSLTYWKLKFIVNDITHFAKCVAINTSVFYYFRFSYWKKTPKSMKSKDIEHVQVIKVSKLRRTLEWLGYELVEIKRFLAIWFSKWYQFHIMSAGLPIVYPEFDPN